MILLEFTSILMDRWSHKIFAQDHRLEYRLEYANQLPMYGCFSRRASQTTIPSGPRTLKLIRGEINHGTFSHTR